MRSVAGALGRNTGKTLAQGSTEIIEVQSLRASDKARLQASTELTKKVAKVTHHNNNNLKIQTYETKTNTCNILWRDHPSLIWTSID
jgi:hypothetical protein